ncbi:hypothetical protein DFH08DRAFT_870073 [Mycena albidolilacea]|uniref:Uncharacterized protein n=1 Tax=Mycena albidolilacea TaxID=1033008 RepID=A0AAD7ESE7_9AGAR|nr:hypothetical protein DFH08DRAFT_870073 [Mycena albidolilacea]
MRRTGRPRLVGVTHSLLLTTTTSRPAHSQTLTSNLLHPPRIRSKKTAGLYCSIRLYLNVASLSFFEHSTPSKEGPSAR